MLQIFGDSVEYPLGVRHPVFLCLKKAEKVVGGPPSHRERAPPLTDDGVVCLGGGLSVAVGMAINTLRPSWRYGKHSIPTAMLSLSPG